MAPIIPILKRMRDSQHGWTGCMLLIALGSGECDMNEMVARTGFSDMTIYQQFKSLRAQKLMTSKISGTPILGQSRAKYRLTPEGGRVVMRLLKPSLTKQAASAIHR